MKPKYTLYDVARIMHEESCGLASALERFEEELDELVENHLYEFLLQRCDKHTEDVWHVRGDDCPDCDAVRNDEAQREAWEKR